MREDLAVVDDEYAHGRLSLGRHSPTVPVTFGRPLDVFGSSERGLSYAAGCSPAARSLAVGSSRAARGSRLDLAFGSASVSGGTETAWLSPQYRMIAAP